MPRPRPAAGLFLITLCACGCNTPRPREASTSPAFPFQELMVARQPQPVFNKPSPTTLSDPRRANGGSPGHVSLEKVPTPRPDPSLAGSLERTGDGPGRETVTTAAFLERSESPEIDPADSGGARAEDEIHPASRADAPDRLFRENLQGLRELLDRIEHGEKLEDFDRLRKADLEKKLISLFFLRGHRDLEEYRQLLGAFSRSRSPVLALEFLKAAFFQELGLTEQRDEILEGLADLPRSRSPGQFEIQFWKMSSGLTDPGRGEQPGDTSSPVFRSGQEILIRGELTGHRDTELSTAPRRQYRRSFSASVTLFNEREELLDRRPLLLAGQATELTDHADTPVRFWGRYALPADLSRGTYTLELLAVDLEGKQTAASTGSFSIR